MHSRATLSCQRLSATLEDWQNAQERLGRDVTRIGVVKREQFGTMDKPKCDFKGAQTNWLLEYIVCEILPAKVDMLGAVGPTILSAGKNALKQLELIRAHKVTIPVNAIQ